jgi:hypothetical protein
MPPLIEVNVKAKQDDPWDTPPLTFEQALVARDEGKFIYIFIKQEDGTYAKYDPLGPSRPYSNPEITKFTTGRYQLRAHKWGRVMVYAPVLVKGWNHDWYWSVVMATSLRILTEKIAKGVLDGQYDENRLSTWRPVSVYLESQMDPPPKLLFT